MANEVCSSLGLNDKELSGKLIQLVEEHSSNAGFMIGCMMWNASKSETAVCLLAIHNSANHYENLAKKLGYNVKMAIENKTLVVIDPFLKYPEMASKCNTTDIQKEDLLKKLLLDVHDILDSLPGRKLLIIDDLSDLMALGTSLPSIVHFLQCCRSIQLSQKNLAIAICTHLSTNSEDQCILSNFVAHTADHRITIAGLKTGFSSNVSGSIDLVNSLDGNNDTNHRGFHFKLTDRHVAIFAPGTLGFHG